MTPPERPVTLIVARRTEILEKMSGRRIGALSMKMRSGMRIVVVIAAAAAVLAAAGTAEAGSVALYAYNAKGKLAKAGKYSRWTRVYRPADRARLKAKTRKRYARKMTFCEKPYYLRSAQARWLAAHRKAKHRIVLRERVSKRKTRRLCKI
jgi:hypothetical protein